MNPEANWDLLTKYLAGECTAAEQQQVQDWRQADARNQRLFEHLRQVWAQSPQDYSQALPDSEALWQRIQAGMRRPEASPFVAVHVNPAAPAPAAEPVRPARSTRWTQWSLRIAASILLILGLGTGAYFWQQPGLVTEQAAAGQQKSVLLPDGTQVWLNAGSQLSYPTEFAAARREVTLTGEAYFEVKHLAQNQSFVIEANGTETTVLGTSFTVTAPKATGAVQVSVVTGRVKLARPSEAGKEVILTPGWTGAYDPARRTVSRAATADPNFRAWQTGVLTFRNTPVREVLTTLARHYHRDLRLQNPALGACHFTGTFEQQPLPKVLQALALTFNAQVVTQPGYTSLVGGSCASETDI